VNIGHNPAVPLIFTSFGLILFGLVSVLYFPFSRLWMYVAPSDTKAGGATLLLRGSAEKSRQGFRRRFEVIGKRIQGEIGVTNSNDSMGGDTQ
jgi:hypothetical protein